MVLTSEDLVATVAVVKGVVDTVEVVAAMVEAEVVVEAVVAVTAEAVVAATAETAIEVETPEEAAAEANVEAVVEAGKTVKATPEVEMTTGVVVIRLGALKAVLQQGTTTNEDRIRRTRLVEDSANAEATKLHQMESQAPTQLLNPTPIKTIHRAMEAWVEALEEVGEVAAATSQVQALQFSTRKFPQSMS